MERYKITLFIFSIIALLALLCAVLPADGVAIAGTRLNFPTLTDVLSGGESEPAMSPEQILEQRRNAVLIAQKGELEEYFRSDPARFILPGGDWKYFDGLFSAFDNADTDRVRIIHYGDSQIEEDRISSTLRERLQEKFGGGGVGLMPAYGYVTVREGESATCEPRRYMVFGDASYRAGNNRYGPAARFSRLDTTMTVSFHPMKSNSGPSRYFNRIAVYAGNVHGSLNVSCKGQRQTMEPGAEIGSIVFDLPDSTMKASVTLSGYADIYGISLENGTGISVDNMPMRGCSGTIFTSISKDQLEYYCKDAAVKMIILQYGGNIVPYTKTAKAISDYCTSVRKQIARFREVAPDAVVVFIGPSDMATSIGGTRRTYPILPQYIDSLKNCVTGCGAAYWDLYSAMGGENSMVEWVKSSPSLAGPDYIHFTPRGAEKVGGMLTDALLVYYEHYRLRHEE